MVAQKLNKLYQIRSICFMDDYLKELLQKYKQGSLSQKEKAILDTWYLKEAEKKSLPEISLSDLEEDLTSMNAFEPAIEVKTSRTKSFYWSAAAILLIGLSSFFYFVVMDSSVAEDKIVMGGNRAELLLGSGELIDLTSFGEHDSIVSGGVTIYKSEEGLVTYQVAANGNKQLSYDEISTPRGGEFKIVLADGTKVHLNANSSLKFFNNLNGAERKVWLNGEAYFEVAHNVDKPFLVNTSEQNIRVLGTKFNVKSESALSQTTLIEGSVSLREGKVKLQPGEQLTTEGGIDQSVIKVDVEPFIAWKEGYFLFNNESLKDVMSKIADWYDIEIEFRDAIQEEKIWATVSKYRDIQEVLRMIELTEAAHFSIKGRRVVITK